MKNAYIANGSGMKGFVMKLLFLQGMILVIAAVTPVRGAVTFFGSSTDAGFASVSNPQATVTFEGFDEGVAAQCAVAPEDAHPTCSLVTQGVTFVSTVVSDPHDAIRFSIGDSLGTPFDSKNLIPGISDTEPDKITGRTHEFYFSFNAGAASAVGFETSSGPASIGGSSPTLLITVEEVSGVDSTLEVSSAGIGRFIGVVSDVGISRIFLADNTPNGGHGFGIDNVQFTAVPEPTSLLLVIAGGCTQFGGRRRGVRDHS